MHPISMTAMVTYASGHRFLYLRTDPAFPSEDRSHSSSIKAQIPRFIDTLEKLPGHEMRLVYKMEKKHLVVVLDTYAHSIHSTFAIWY